MSSRRVGSLLLALPLLIMLAGPASAAGQPDSGAGDIGDVHSPAPQSLPIMIALFGVGPSSKVAMGALSCFFPVALSVASGMALVSPVHLRVRLADLAATLPNVERIATLVSQGHVAQLTAPDLLAELIGDFARRVLH